MFAGSGLCENASANSKASSNVYFGKFGKTLQALAKSAPNHEPPRLQVAGIWMGRARDGPNHRSFGSIKSKNVEICLGSLFGKSSGLQQPREAARIAKAFRKSEPPDVGCQLQFHIDETDAAFK